MPYIKKIKKRKKKEMVYYSDSYDRNWGWISYVFLIVSHYSKKNSISKNSTIKIKNTVKNTYNV